MTKTRVFTLQELARLGLPKACVGGTVLSHTVIEDVGKVGRDVAVVVVHLDSQPDDEAWLLSYAAPQIEDGEDIEAILVHKEISLEEKWMPWCEEKPPDIARYVALSTLRRAGGVLTDTGGGRLPVQNTTDALNSAVYAINSLRRIRSLDE